jgi:hypothetical protein
MKKGVLSAMRNATREPFAHGCVLGIGLAKMRCIILYGRGPSHGSISYYCSLQFWLVKRQSALCALYRSTRTGRVGHLAGRIAGGGHAQVMRRGRSHPLLARAQGTSTVMAVIRQLAGRRNHGTWPTIV